jgi:hypothetical protein
MIQFIYAWLTKIYGELTGAGLPLVTGTMKLLGEPLVWDGTQVVGDVVEPVYTGYADAAIAAWTPAVNETGVPFLTADPSVFSPTDAVGLPVFIYGAAIVDADGDLVAISVWDAPLQFTLPDQQLHVTAKVFLDPTTPTEIEGSFA